MPSWGPVKSAYAFCARCVIDEMGRWFFKTGFRGKSAYFFEAGHASQSEANDAVEFVLTNPLSRFVNVHFGYVAHSFILKEDFPAIQTADILAWQWATDIKHRTAGRNRRKDFESLLSVPTVATHFDKERLLNYVDLLKEFGVNRKLAAESTEELVRRMQYIQARVRPALLR